MNLRHFGKLKTKEKEAGNQAGLFFLKGVPDVPRVFQSYQNPTEKAVKIP
jgi:hypothetical protein